MCKDVGRRIEERSDMANQGNERGGSGNFENDPQRASEAGRKGVQQSGGNFADDPQRASEAGRKGGQESSENFAADPQRAAEAGRKGGQQSGSGQQRSGQQQQEGQGRRAGVRVSHRVLREAARRCWAAASGNRLRSGAPGMQPHYSTWSLIHI